MEGEVVSTGTVVLRAKSQVKGTITTETLVVEAGAIFNGESNMMKQKSDVTRPEMANKK